MNTKEKDVPKPTTDLSEDLFKVHDFDVKIDLQVPSAGDVSPGLFFCPWKTNLIVHVIHNTLSCVCSAEAKSLSVSSNALPVKDGAPRRSLNLEDYKKRRGLI